MAPFKSVSSPLVVDRELDLCVFCCGYAQTLQSNPSSLAQDLPYRTNCDREDISERLGWLTWEDLKSVNKDYFRWLD